MPQHASADHGARHMQPPHARDAPLGRLRSQKTSSVEDQRRHRATRNDLAGRAAEASVERFYERRGWTIASRRWRGQAGEVDLIARDGNDLVFIEVKTSRTFEQAAHALSMRQMRRLCTAAAEFVAGIPGGGHLGVRFDLALVDGIGRIDVRENAFSA